MKKILRSIWVGVFLIILGRPSLAADVAKFQLSASIPKAASVGFTVSKVTGSTWSSVTGTDLSFDTMEYKTGTENNNINIWLPDHYFAIDIAPVNGVGGVDVIVTYDETVADNPNAATGGHGLGWKATATFVKVTGSGTATTDTGLTSHGPKKMLKDLNGETIAATETAGGWLRIYLGIVSKDKTAKFPDPTNSEPFTNSDKNGSYEGTLTLSATVS